MKTTFSLALAVGLVLAVLSEIGAHAATVKKAPSAVAPTQVEASADLDAPELRRNAMSLELLGRGLLYSFNYDKMVTNDLALGAGVSHYGFSSGTSSLSAWIIPVYANYYFTGGKNRWFATGGADVILSSGSAGDDAKVSGSGIAGVLGAGFEHRGDNGFLFRVAPYALVGKPKRRRFLSSILTVTNGLLPLGARRYFCLTHLDRTNARTAFFRAIQKGPP
jgi:hypothetical protein